MSNPFEKKRTTVEILTLINSGVLFLIMSFAVFSTVVIYPMLKNHPRVQSLKNKILAVMDLSYLWYTPSKSRLPVYDLRVSADDLETLNANLPREGSRWMERSAEKRYVPARFTYKGREHKVKVRYRGITQDHWRGAKKSWRIKFQKEELFEEMRSINLIIPEDRGYIKEHVNYHIAEKLGLIVPKNRFVVLRLNGVFQGVYFEVEQWSKEFMERNRQPDSNLYGEDDRDLALRERGLIDQEIYSDVGFWRKYNDDKIFQFSNYGELDSLLQLLNRSGDEEFAEFLPQVLDMENFYRWQVHSILAGSHHQNFWHNVRIYFDQKSGQFRFIPWDVSGEPAASSDENYNPLVSRVLSIPPFREARNRVLWEYVRDEAQLSDDLAFFDKTFEEVKHAFLADRKKGFSNLQFLEDIKKARSIMIENTKLLLENLQFSRIFANIRYPLRDTQRGGRTVLAHIEFVSDGYAGILWEAMRLTTQKESSSLKGAALYRDQNNDGEPDPGDDVIGRLEEVGPNLYEINSINLQLYSKKDRLETTLDHYLKLLKPRAERYHYLVATESAGEKPDPYPQFSFKMKNFVTGEPAAPIFHYMDGVTFRFMKDAVTDREAFLRKWPIFHSNQDGGIRLSKGIYPIDRTLVIPRGLPLIIEPGTTLRFGPRVSLFSYSAITAKGTPDNPISFTASDPQRPWGVLAVLNTQRVVNHFEHVIIEHAKDAYINGVYCTGALALHYSDVVIQHSLFRWNHGDDALNVKNGHATIRTSYFYENEFDGVDFDFSSGIIEDSVFHLNGNDGIDVSGSRVRITGNRIHGNGDKGISIGERSEPLIFNNLLLQNETAIAVKDGSAAKIINNTIVENKQGVSLYTKKTMFGASQAFLWNTLVWGNKSNIEIARDSNLWAEFSDIQNGFKGRNVVSIQPVFHDEEAGDFTLREVEANKALLTGGSVNLLREHNPAYARPSVPIGILTLPPKHE